MPGTFHAMAHRGNRQSKNSAIKTSQRPVGRRFGEYGSWRIGDVAKWYDTLDRSISEENAPGGIAGRYSPA
jgi:hypothetical protein